MKLKSGREKEKTGVGVLCRHRLVERKEKGEGVVGALGIGDEE